MSDVIGGLRSYLPAEVYDSLAHCPTDKRREINEIRLRLKRACSITVSSRNETLINYKTAKSIALDENEMQKCFRRICENSLYKYENEIKNGYITLPNGCRVGFCGSRTESGLIKDISSINIRIARNIDDAAREIFPLLFENNEVVSSLIVSQPCAGKTTILTDIACKLSEQKLRVAIIDERGEIAAAHRGVPIKNVGAMCDILDNYPKGEGMMIALRSLSPQVMICDEIGTSEDVTAMMQALNAGVPVIASAHASDARQLMSRPQLRYLIDNGAIGKVFFLEGPMHPGKLKSVARAEKLYEIDRDNSYEHGCIFGS